MHIKQLITLRITMWALCVTKYKNQFFCPLFGTEKIIFFLSLLGYNNKMPWSWRPARYLEIGPSNKVQPPSGYIITKIPTNIEIQWNNLSPHPKTSLQSPGQRQFIGVAWCHSISIANCNVSLYSPNTYLTFIAFFDHCCPLFAAGTFILIFHSNLSKGAIIG